MRILASICNKRRSEELKHPGVFLYEIDTQREEVRPIDLGDCLTLEVEGLNGATGLSHFRRGFLVALQSEPSLLLHLRRDYSVQNIIRMSKVRSAHSVVVRGDSILVVSTGSDSVVEIRGDQRERIFWCDNLEGCDSIHVNSLAWHRGELYLCAFGRKEGELWSTASCGYIQNVATSELLVTGVFHPHSLFSVDGRLYFCESSRSVVRCDDGDYFPAIPPGYTRGLIVADTHLFVGMSKGRLTSVSTGKLIHNPADPGVKTGHCSVRIYKRARPLSASRLEKEIILDEYGEEIYDLLPVASV